MKQEIEIKIYFPIEKQAYTVLNKMCYYDIFFAKMRNFTCDKLNYKYCEVSYIEKNSKKLELSDLTKEELQFAKDNSLIKKANIMIAIPVLETYYKKISNSSRLQSVIDKYDEDIQLNQLYSDSICITFKFIEDKKGKFENFTHYLDRNNINWE